MIDENKVLDQIAELLGQSSEMHSIYGHEENVAYACGMVDQALFSLMRYVEGLVDTETE